MLLAASELPTLSHWELLLRLGLAVALGAIIGAERELRERMAPVIALFERLDVRLKGVAYDDSGDEGTVLAVCELPAALDQTRLIDELSTLPEVKGARWGIA